MGEYSGEIIQQIKTESVIITNTVYSNKKNNPNWHSHENLHICLVFQGGKVDTKHTTKYAKKSGSIFFYHSDEEHRWITTQPISKSINIEISEDFLKQYNYTEFQIKEAIEKGFYTKSLILKMQQEMLINEKESYLSIQSLLLELVSKSEKSSNNNPPKWIDHLHQLLRDNWEAEMPLSEMAQTLKIHPVTISKNFRKYFGCTLGEYRRKLKIEKSIELIKTSNESLSQIAFHCGFADQSHFIRNFKLNTGFLPKDFRKY